jgi:general secretion pathway protein A
MALTTPFSTNPNPALLYLTPALKATLAKIQFVIDYRQGLTALLGDIGMGKSTVIRRLHMDYSLRDDCAVALIPSPNFPSDFGLLKGICKELGVPPKRSMVEQEDALREYLFAALEADRGVVVFLDEAQRLTTKMLELVRTLLNLETNTTKLIQIVLSGQLELRDRLRDPARRALRSRIMTPSLLDPLAPDEMAAMIAFRCQQGGELNPFTPEALTALYAASGGIPRDTLKLCSIAWQGAKALGVTEIGPDLIEMAVEEEATV